MYLKYHNTFNRCRCRHLSRVPTAVLSRNHITSKRLLLTGSLSNDDGDVKENGKKEIGLDNQKSTNLRAKRAEL